MGEAKRRKDLGILPKKNITNIDKSNWYITLISITKARIKNYPYIGVATMALGAIIFLISGGLNSIS